MFRFNAGTIDLKLHKVGYSVNEKIEGRVLLSLNQPVRARGLYAILYADQKFREQVCYGNQVEMRTVTRRIYNFLQQLDTEKEYRATDRHSEYPFSIPVPAEAAAISKTLPGSRNRTAKPPGKIPDDHGQGPVGMAQWTIEGYLDIPSEFNVEARIPIVIQ